MPIRPEDAVRANPRCLLTELGDGSGVVLDLDTKFYFTLNRTGVTAWNALAAQPEGATAEGVAMALVERFDVTADAALKDVLTLFNVMASEGLIQPA